MDFDVVEINGTTYMRCSINSDRIELEGSEPVYDPSIHHYIGVLPEQLRVLYSKAHQWLPSDDKKEYLAACGLYSLYQSFLRHFFPQLEIYDSEIICQEWIVCVEKLGYNNPNNYQGFRHDTIIH